MILHVDYPASSCKEQKGLEPPQITVTNFTMEHPDSANASTSQLTNEEINRLFEEALVG